MRRKKAIMIVVLTTVLFLLVNRTDIMASFEEGYMSVKSLDAQGLERMTQGFTRMQDRPEILFNGHKPAYDTAAGRFFVTQNMDNGTWDGGFTCEDGELYWEEDVYFAKYRQALGEGHSFKLYWIDEADVSYSVCEVVFTGMPIMTIATESGAEIGDELQAARMEVSDMKFAGPKYQGTACQVSVRGQSSRSFAKQGYKLTLDRKMALLGMRRDEDWILSALYDDDGLIHNKFSYDVWRAIASDNSSAKDNGTVMEYVELFNNDVYMGVYGLTERIDAKELALEKNDILYKCRGFAEPDETIPEDYGLSVDYDIKYPKAYAGSSWTPLKEYLDIFTAGEITDYDAAKSFLNMENAIDFNIFIILTRACDNYTRKNTFFVAEYDKHSGNYTMLKIPWDCNATWGNSLYKGNFDRKLYNASWAHCAYVWSSDIKMMYECFPNEIQELTLARWKQLREDILSDENLYSMLDEDFSYLHGSGAYDRNYVRWEEHGRENWQDAYIYEYVENRLAFLDAYFVEPYFDEVPLTEEE